MGFTCDVQYSLNYIYIEFSRLHVFVIVFSHVLVEIALLHFPTSLPRFPQLATNIGRETVMRTFHPYSSSHIQMPEAALQQQLNKNSSTSSPTSPVQSTLDLLVNPTSSPPHILANKIGEQFQHSNHIQSSNNNVIPTVTSAPPSVLSNTDPNASLQSLLAANRKDSAAPDSLHQWGIPPVQPSPQPHHSSPHITTATAQVSTMYITIV